MIIATTNFNFGNLNQKTHSLHTNYGTEFKGLSIKRSFRSIRRCKTNLVDQKVVYFVVNAKLIQYMFYLQGKNNKSFHLQTRQTEFFQNVSIKKRNAIAKKLVLHDSHSENTIDSYFTTMSTDSPSCSKRGCSIDA